ncbi:MAG: alpha/beta hydrolase [Phycisphaeraceae bacterium]|nr:alpha/beta hydrolase [Phycisphaeraceae bacterium]
MSENQVLPIWPKDSPHQSVEADGMPNLTVYLPDNVSTGGPRAAVIVCPGGAYSHLAPHEGAPFAELFARHGLVGFVLRYRVSPNRFPLPYCDGTRAVRYVRHHAARWNVDPNRIGIMGFSAGGHLASTVACQPNLYLDPHDDLADKVSARPNRLILGYPVISFVSHYHSGSAAFLIGDDYPSVDMRRKLSNELHVTSEHPATFIFHTSDDAGVPIENALMYATALSARNVSCELHAYAHGPHGVGLAEDDPMLRGWTGLLVNWLGNWKRA